MFAFLHGIPNGVHLWLAALVVAAVLPPLLMRWRADGWRLSLRQALLVFALVGPACLLLADDLTRLGAVGRFHLVWLVRDPGSWCLVIGLPVVGVFACSAVCSGWLVRGRDGRALVEKFLVTWRS